MNDNIEVTNNKKKKFIKIIVWVPVIVMSLLIFSFSSQTGSESGGLSKKAAVMIVNTISNMHIIDITDDNIDVLSQKLEYPIRKIAHMTEYMILGLFVMLALYVWDFRGRMLYLITFFTTVVFASTDEIHQLFVAGRSGQITDVCIDAIGVFTGLLIVFVISKTKKALYDIKCD